MKDLLHVYGQEFWHNDVTLVGTRDALAKLQFALTVALTADSGRTTSEPVYVADGEGYVVHVVVATSEQMNSLPMPYTDSVAKERHQEKWDNLHRLAPAD